MPIGKYLHFFAGAQPSFTTSVASCVGLSDLQEKP
jgi:hypothetical protein